MTNIQAMNNLLSVPDLIAKKRDGLELSTDEIKQFIGGLSNDAVQDCQVGAMLMAIYVKGNRIIDIPFHLTTFFRYD